MTNLSQGHASSQGDGSDRGRADRFRAPYRILVVDDSQDTVDSMRVLLKLLGAEVRTALGALEALDAAQTFRPQVVLLDIGMPKVHGYDAARRFREQDWGKEAVLLALTGWGREEDRRRAEQAGFDGHLTKPVQVADLRDMVEQFIEQRPSQS